MELESWVGRIFSSFSWDLMLLPAVLDGEDCSPGDLEDSSAELKGSLSSDFTSFLKHN